MFNNQNLFQNIPSSAYSTKRENPSVCSFFFYCKLYILGELMTVAGDLSEVTPK